MNKINNFFNKKLIFLCLILLSLSLYFCGDGVIHTENKCDTPNTIPCDSKCVNNLFDHDNCGTCNNICDSKLVCSFGVCLSDCSGVFTKCDDMCVNLYNDINNCGSCGKKCIDTICFNSNCVEDCPDELEKCGQTCVDTKKDVNNCGQCGKTCSDNEICSDGICGVKCGSGLNNCNGTCTNLLTDPQNCGECDKQCTGEMVCNNGECSLQCSDELDNCNGACVNLQTDPLNCGICDKQCSNGEICDQGDCTSQCSGNLQLCGNSCVDILTDRYNCNGCGNVCDSDRECSSGQCQCSNGMVDCNGCVDITRDNNNCNGCGNICPENRICVDRECNCNNDLLECDGECVDTNLDRNNCGQCNKTCGDNEVCQNGSCEADCGNLKLCNNQCVNTTNDPLNCGDCNVNCNGISCINSNCQEFEGDNCNNYFTINLGDIATGSTTGAGNDYSGGGGPDLVFKFTIYESNDIFIHTIGSSFDTIIYVGSQCGTSNVGINDNGAGNQSILQLSNLAAGDYYIVVDGYDSNSYGNFVLEIEASPPGTAGDGCGHPNILTLSGSITLSGSTESLNNYAAPTNCMSGSGNDVVYFIPIINTSVGSYTFSLCDGTSWDTVLYLRSGCSSSDLVCDDDACGFESAITYNFTTLGGYFLWLDGFFSGDNGSYTMTITDN